jgi:DNA invertase Pin-like site-specific DNA recombinase
MAIDPNQRHRIFALHESGLSIRAIASATGCSPTTVHKYLTQLFAAGDTVGSKMKKGRDGKSRPSRRIDTSERDAEIIKLRQDHHTLTEIADLTNCSVGTAHRVLKSQDASDGLTNPK